MIDFSPITITRDGSNISFESKDGIDIGLSISRKDGLDNSYYTVQDNISFNSTYEYKLQANNLYKFTFNYKRDGEIISIPTTSPPAVPELPALPSITIPDPPDVSSTAIPPIPTVAGSNAITQDITAYSGQIAAILNSIALQQQAISSFSIKVNEYNREKDTYNDKVKEYEALRKVYSDALNSYNADGSRKVSVEKIEIYEYMLGYFPNLLDNIIYGSYYILKSFTDTDSLYNNKDRHANAIIMRILYYNSLCLNNCNSNIIYCLNALYNKLLVNTNIFNSKESLKGLDNTFIQEKIIIACYYLCYLLDELKYSKNKSSALKRFKFDEIKDSFSLVNIDFRNIFNAIGLNIDGNRNVIESSDINISLDNRGVYNFSTSDFNTNDITPTHITFVSIPLKGILSYKGSKISLGQRIPFNDISSVSYISNNIDNAYTTEFKFILE